MPVRHGLVAALLLGATVVPATAWAHTDIDYTLPTDGASTGDVVTEITVAFNEPVTLIGPGFEVLDPQGRVLTPFVVTDDDVVFRLQMDPPLGGGLVAVKYTVAALDGHALEGNFTFTVAADAPVVTEPPATTISTTTPTTTTTTTTTPPTSTSAPMVPASTDVVAAASDPPTTSPATDAVEVVAGQAVAPATDGHDGGSSTTLVLAGLGALVAAAFGVLLMRSRAGA